MKTFKIIFLFIALMIVNQGCFDDLNTVPIDEDIVTNGVVYDDPAVYKQVLAKLYAGLAVSGQQGPAGDSDISGIDEGFGQYLRGFWYHQELPTDEAVIGWNDQTISDFHDLDWTSGDGFIFAFYSRIFYQVALCNEFLRQTEPDVLEGREVTGDLLDEIQEYRAEARFLRALSYWHALDNFRSVPFVTEDDPVGSFFPTQISAVDLFAFIENELLEIENEIIPAQQNEYGRADAAAVQTLLAKLYLNAETYIGTKRYDDCKTYCEKVISAGYTLEPEYKNLFLADNHNSNEIIFPIAFDGINTRTWGGMTFIIRAGIGGDIDPTASGVVSGWGGTRTTKEIVNKFGEIGGLIAPYIEKTNFPQIYIAGDHQGNSIDGDYAINSLNSDKIYEGIQYFPEDNMTFQIAPNPTLSFIYGDNGADGTLEIAGDRIVTGAAGLYYFRVDMNDKTYEIQRVDKIVASGSAVDGNPEFTFDVENRLFNGFFDLSPGDLSFELVGTSGLALGDSNGDGVLTIGEGGLMVDFTEAVAVELDLQKQQFTYQIGSSAFDRRAIFSSEGQNIEINEIALFNDGYAVTKFKNISSDGIPGSDTDFPDTDFPMFRLADVHLMAAEAILRDGGSATEAVEHYNIVRQRAYNGQGGNASAADFGLDDIIDERARELYWECHRRTDLVRFGLLTTADYLWTWKGGVQDGQAVESYRDVYPIPSADLNANPNLEQNTGY